MTHELDTTFHLLATTKNEAAVTVLGAALRTMNPAVRQLALDAMIARRSPAVGRKLIDQWDSLSEADRAKMHPESTWLITVLQEDLKEDSATVLRAIRIVRTLSIDPLVVPLVDLAESHEDDQVRREAIEAVRLRVGAIGTAARQDRDRSSLRGPIVARLAQSLSGYKTHRCKELIDAFLGVSTWTDRQLWAVLGDDSTVASVVRDRLRVSQAPDVVSLLAAAVDQRRCPPAVRSLIAVRQEADFRDALLDVIGGELSPNIRTNLRAIGTPACCRGGAGLMEQLRGTRRTSLALLYSVTEPDPCCVLEMLISALESSPADQKANLLHAVPAVPPLDADRLLHAAIFVAQKEDSQNEPKDWANEPNAVLLRRLLRLLEDGDATMERVVQRILAPLHTDNIIDLMERFRPATQRKIGEVVVRTDVEAADRLRERLRHPSLSRRLQAIAAAEAFGIIDQLSVALIRIARDDHQEARLAAIAALSHSRRSDCWSVIQEFAAGPDSSIRDAALAALSSSTGEACDV